MGFAPRGHNCIFSRLHEPGRRAAWRLRALLCPVLRQERLLLSLRHVGEVKDDRALTFGVLVLQKYGVAARCNLQKSITSCWKRCSLGPASSNSGDKYYDFCATHTLVLLRQNMLAGRDGPLVVTSCSHMGPSGPTHTHTPQGFKAKQHDTSFKSTSGSQRGTLSSCIPDGFTQCGFSLGRSVPGIRGGDEGGRRWPRWRRRSLEERQRTTGWRSSGCYLPFRRDQEQHAACEFSSAPPVPLPAEHDDTKQLHVRLQSAMHANGSVSF